jgi:hypothetical protein
MEQLLGFAIAVALTAGLVVTGRVLQRRLGVAPYDGRTVPWSHGSRLAGYAAMSGPVPELEIVRLGRLLAREVEEFLAAQTT